jgi:predicted HTH domain antitoxin
MVVTYSTRRVVMAISIEIPDDILETVKLPPDRAKQELTKEMAFSLYQRKLVSMGNARKLSGLDKWDFLEGLAERGIERHYSEHDLEEDLKYGSSE